MNRKTETAEGVANTVIAAAASWDDVRPGKYRKGFLFQTLIEVDKNSSDQQPPSTRIFIYRRNGVSYTGSTGTFRDVLLKTVEDGKEIIKIRYNKGWKRSSETVAVVSNGILVNPNQENLRRLRRAVQRYNRPRFLRPW